MLTSQTIEQQNISRPFSNSSPQKLCLYAGEFMFFFKLIYKKKAICDWENLCVIFLHKFIKMFFSCCFEFSFFLLFCLFQQNFLMFDKFIMCVCVYMNQGKTFVFVILYIFLLHILQQIYKWKFNEVPKETAHTKRRNKLLIVFFLKMLQHNFNTIFFHKKALYEEMKMFIICSKCYLMYFFSVIYFNTLLVDAFYNRNYAKNIKGNSKLYYYYYYY